MKIRKDVVSTLNALCDKTGLDLCLTGGAVRDMLHEIELKDLDFEILNFDIEKFEAANFCIMEYTSNLENLLDEIGCTNTDVYTAYEGSTVKEITFVIKLKFNGFDCDLILSQQEPTTPEQAVAPYDISLNQCGIYNNQLFVHHNFTCNPVVPTGKPISKKRMDRIKAKYPDYDFSLVEPYIVE